MKLKRVMTAVCVTAAAGVLPLIAATPASAYGPSYCERYLASKEYIVGSGVKASCRYAGSAGTVQFCSAGLINLGVRENHAFQACRAV
ncbi:hypothetical protein ACFZAG_14110 [Streptomyces sp. NPDC012403]|jgi:hypothetical protein|uniref:hypothetical protein n=1 Tax=Streptomyces sp. NPDC012403 TaxID=3364831 RepID=UPI0036E5D49B